MAALKIKNQITSSFKMHGLTLRSEASRYLVEVLAAVSDGQREDCIDKILEAVQKQPLKSSMIDRSICESAVQECNEEQEETSLGGSINNSALLSYGTMQDDVAVFCFSDKVFSIIDAFSVPRYTYSQERKKFLPSSNMGKTCPRLHTEGKAKADLFRERYSILHQRTSRHELFTPPALGSHASERSKKFQLKPIEFLLGSTAKLGEIIVLGMLTQLKEGKWYLEDPSGAVLLDLAKSNFHHGLFTENCFVLAEGWYEDEVFHVNAFGFPPPEPAKATRAYFGNINFFGGPSATTVKASAKLKQLEKDNEDAMFVFLSDVWLDKVKVLEKLRTLFTGYAEMPPTCFVMCGDFISAPVGKQARELKDCLRTLAELILEFPSLVQNSRFVFVPGPRDPGPAHILPRPAIPDSITEDFCRRIPSATFTSNPCRIQFCTQEIVVFREDIVMKMCRNCVRFPADSDIPAHFSKTLICQGHLCPLPLHVAPTYWDYDNALRLYPLPDLVVCADKYDPFSSSHVDTAVINPGSFPRCDFSFKVYWPASRQIEESRIDD